MGYTPQKVHSAAQVGIRCNSMLDVAQQRRRAEETEKLQMRQFAYGGADTLQDRERVLVRVQMPDPKNGGIARKASQSAGLFPVSGPKTAGGFGYFILMLSRMKETGLCERPRLLQRAKRNPCGDGHLTPPQRSAPDARWSIRLVLQDDWNARGQRG